MGMFIKLRGPAAQSRATPAQTRPLQLHVRPDDCKGYAGYPVNCFFSFWVPFWEGWP